MQICKVFCKHLYAENNLCCEIWLSSFIYTENNCDIPAELFFCIFFADKFAMVGLKIAGLCLCIQSAAY